VVPKEIANKEVVGQARAGKSPKADEATREQGDAVFREFGAT
jgi:hypothetical protein